MIDRIKGWLRESPIRVVVAMVLWTLLLLFGLIHQARADGPSLIVLGKSFHFGGNTNGLNGSNPGLGIEYAKGPWFVGGLTYYDSYRKQAASAYVGYRYTFFTEGEWRAFASLRGGYIHGSGFNGPMVLPTVGITYKHASLEVMYIPKVSNSTVNVIGLFGRWEF
jgi:hypothetical protein